MGLLDLLNDPQMRLGIGLLGAGGPRPVKQNFGQRVGGLLAEMDDQEARKRAEAMAERKLAIEEALKGAQMQQLQEAMAARKEAADQAALDRGLTRQQYSPLPGPTQDQGPLMPRFDPKALLGQGGSVPAVMNMVELEKALQTQKAKPIITKPGDIARGEGGEVLWQNPQEAEKTPEALRTLAMIYGLGSPEYLQAARSLALKMTTHQPGVSVSYGVPMQGINDKGESVFFAPPKDPTKQAPVILGGVRPPAKEMSAGMVEKFATNEVTLKKIDRALTLLDERPSAVGVKNYAPDALIQRLDPKGVPVRAMIADIGGQKIHDRSGAAVTVGEAERLRPYIPAATDDEETARQKLKLFRNEYKAMQQALASGASIRQVAADQSKSGRVRFDSQGNEIKD